MIDLLRELASGEFKVTKREHGSNAILDSYRTKRGISVQVSNSVMGVSVYVCGIEMSGFQAWLIRWAMRRGATK